MLPDLDSLALFVRAAELRSLTKAAEASHMGVAAASRRMALLEHRFKTPLLLRTSRGVELTPAGVALLPYARTLLVQINQMNAEMRDHAHGSRGVLRILANTSVMTESLPDDLARFARANPDVRLVVEERWSDEIARALLAAEGDLGIMVEGLPTPGLQSFPYRSDSLAAVMPPGHPLASQETVKFADVVEEELIALESGSSMMRLLAQQAVILEKTLHLRVQVRSFEAVCRMVQAGLGTGILPFEAASLLGTAMGLAVRRLTDPWAERNMVICVRKDRPVNLSLNNLLEHLTQPSE